MQALSRSQPRRSRSPPPLASRSPPRSRRACGHGWPARLTCSRHGGGAGLGDGGSAGIIVGGVAGLGDAAATEATASWGHARANEATAAGVDSSFDADMKKGAMELPLLGLAASLKYEDQKETEGV